MKSLLKTIPVFFLAGFINVNNIEAANLNPAPKISPKYYSTVLQDTITNKARAKKGVNEVGSGAKEVGKGTKDLAVSGAKATGKGAKKAGKTVKKTAKKGVEKVDNAVD